MSGHGANPIFFNKKNKDWTSKTIVNPHPQRPVTSDFCLRRFAIFAILQFCNDNSRELLT